MIYSSIPCEDIFANMQKRIEFFFFIYIPFNKSIPEVVGNVHINI